MAIEATTINGYAPSWVSLIIDVGGTKITGAKSIEFSEKIENAIVYGLGSVPMGQTEGVYKVEGCKLTVFTRTAKLLRAELAKLSPNKKSVSFPQFTITILIRNAAEDNTEHETRITGCKVVENTFSSSQGPEPIEETIALSALRIERDGLTLAAA